MAKASASLESAAAAAVKRTHPRYQKFYPTWVELGYVYEGDGPYMDGTALVPHAREVQYATKDGVTDYNTVVGNKRKFTARQELAAYENFAETIVDTLTTYQYAPEITRKVEGSEKIAAELKAFWSDCDGFGTHIGDWFEQHQPLVDVYGHAFVVMDRDDQNPTKRRTNESPEGQKTKATLADLGRPVLRLYVPPDALDWLAPRNHLSAVKFVEVDERKTLMAAAVTDRLRYYIWDEQKWTTYSQDGDRIGGSAHGHGRIPVRVWYARRRARIPVIGRSILGDPKVFKDRYNMRSELRELFRSQVFSMLTVELGDDEQITEARARMGDHVGADALMFTRGGATYIAPPDGPVTMYMEALEKAEREMFRRARLPYDNDSKDAESADSRRLKASDLNQLLASLATEAQMADMWTAESFLRAMLGGKAGAAAFTEAQVTINHPDNFDTEMVAAIVEEAKSVIEIGVGKTATKLLRMKVIKASLDDVDQKTMTEIETEVEGLSAQDDEKRAVELENMKTEAAFLKGAAEPEPPPSTE